MNNKSKKRGYGTYQADIERLGERIQELRRRHKLTQEELSEETKIERGQIVKIETGTTNPTFTTLLRISKALKIKVTELVDVDEKCKWKTQTFDLGS